MYLWVPIGVVEDAGVGSLQVNAQAACLGVEDVDEQVGVWRVETVDVYHALHPRCAAIQPHIPGKHQPLETCCITHTWQWYNLTLEFWRSLERFYATAMSLLTSTVIKKHGTADQVLAPCCHRQGWNRRKVSTYL